MSDDFLSCDGIGDRIYRHDGFSSAIKDWIWVWPDLEAPLALAWDGSNLLWYCDSLGSEKIYKHSGFTPPIIDSFSPPGTNVQGLCWDGTNLLSVDEFLDKIYKHDGFSSTILDSFPTPAGACLGVAWDGTDLLSVDLLTEKIYKHSGFSSSITDSFSKPGFPKKLDWYGGNLYSGDGAAEEFYKHDGFSSSITDSFPIPATSLSGLVWGTGMAPPSQFGRPGGDISVGSWSPFPASPTTLWDKIDEQFDNRDTDYIFSDTKGDECEFSLPGLTDPETGLNHFLACIAKCPAGAGKGESLYIALVENGTVRAQSPTHPVGRVFWEYIRYDLTEAEANSITNYANLRLRIHIVEVGGGEPIRVTQAEFKCPPAPVAPQTLIPDGIASLEAFGTAELWQGWVLQPSAIGSLEAFGTLKTNFKMFPSAIGSLEAVGIPSVIQKILLPSGIGSLEAFGNGKLNLKLFPEFVPSAEGFGTSKLNLRLLLSAIESSEAFGAAQLNLRLLMQAIASEEAFGTLEVIFGIISISPDGIASLEAFGIPYVRGLLFYIGTLAGLICGVEPEHFPGILDFKARLEPKSLIGGKLEDKYLTSGKLEERVLLIGKLKDDDITVAELEERSVTEGELEEKVVVSAKLDEKVTIGAKLENRIAMTGRLESKFMASARLETSLVTKGKLEECP